MADLGQGISGGGILPDWADQDEITTLFRRWRGG
jgi:hypothetical protein